MKLTEKMLKELIKECYGEMMPPMPPLAAMPPMMPPMAPQEPVGGAQTPIDDEGRMAKSQLAAALRAAQELESMLSDDEQLEGWVQAKITKASDYLKAVRDYLAYEKGAM